MGKNGNVASIADSKGDGDVVGTGSNIRDTNQKSVTTTGSGKSQEEESLIGELIQIPKQKLIELLGGCGVDAKGNGVPLWAIDPYPGQQKKTDIAQDESSPMVLEMFHWLAKHLILNRPKRLVQPASGDRGQYVPHPISLKLDRLHCSGATRLLDGSLVVLQILQGK